VVSSHFTHVIDDGQWSLVISVLIFLFCPAKSANFEKYRESKVCRVILFLVIKEDRRKTKKVLKK
jgi:hypothetical protein